MAYKVPEGTTRFNVYLRNELFEKMVKACSENMMSKTSFLNMVLKQYFDGQEAMQSMGNLSELMKVFASQTGIDLSAPSDENA